MADIADVQWLDDSEAIITVQYRRLFGVIPPKVRRYRGSGTVWHDADTGRRQSSYREMLLCDIWTLRKWGETGKVVGP